MGKIYFFFFYQKNAFDTDEHRFALIIQRVREKHILNFWVKNLSVNSYFIKFPLWKRGNKGDFAIKRFSNPPSPPFAKGGKLITDKFLIFISCIICFICVHPP